jgi:hypothetical protein
MNLRLRLFAARSLDGRFDRTDQDMRITAFQAGLALNRPVGGEIGGKSHEQLLPEIGVSDFPAAELYHSLDAIPLLEKSDGMVLLEIVIVIVSVGTELQFLHLFFL